MKLNFLNFIVLAIILTGISFGVAGVIVNSMDAWSPRSYIPKPGDCFVPSKGDPLYDAWYAGEVNGPNCDAFQAQETAKQITAITDRIEWETTQAQAGVFSLLSVFAILITVLIVATVTSQKH